MASNYDATEFVDTDFQAHKSPGKGMSAASLQHLAPSREEVDTKVAETQQKLAELKRTQEELERERASLEELRRRQMEFHTGRDEMTQHLTRGLGLLEEAEFTARRDAEQMAKTISGFREALSKIQTVHEETWTQDSFNVELTRALTAVENARMEWNSARLKLAVLNGDTQPVAAQPKAADAASPLGARSFGELFKLGLALTWPLALVALLALAAFVVLMLIR